MPGAQDFGFRVRGASTSGESLHERFQQSHVYKGTLVVRNAHSARTEPALKFVFLRL